MRFIFVNRLTLTSTLEWQLRLTVKWVMVRKVTVLTVMKSIWMFFKVIIMFYLPRI